jgi:hypothetical protein
VRYHLFLLINLNVPSASTQNKNFKNWTPFQSIAWDYSVKKSKSRAR